MKDTRNVGTKKKKNYLTHNNLFYEIFKKWDELNGDQEPFIAFLKKNKWKPLARGITFKRTFYKDKYVLKFDIGMKLDNKKVHDGFEHSGKNAETSHTASENRHWQRSKNIPHRAKYICPTLAYHRGLLIQPLLDNVNPSFYSCEEKYIKIAKELRFSHFWHYGFLDGEVKWFDVDHLGENWTNWKLKKDKHLTNL